MNEWCLNCDYRVCVFVNVCVAILRINCCEIHAYKQKRTQRDKLNYLLLLIPLLKRLNI